jgi:lipocalin
MTIDKSTVESFTLDKYLGTWYEIARLPNRFEKDLVGVTATYKMRDDGKVAVINQGFKNTLDGKLKKATGKARIPDPTKAKLEVSFFWIFYSDYYILELDTVDYQYAMVGSSSDNYLWILSRTPQLDKEIYDRLVHDASKRGYDTDQLFNVPQKTHK